MRLNPPPRQSVVSLHVHAFNASFVIPFKTTPTFHGRPPPQAEMRELVSRHPAAGRALPLPCHTATRTAPLPPQNLREGPIAASSPPHSASRFDQRNMIPH